MALGVLHSVSGPHGYLLCLTKKYTFSPNFYPTTYSPQPHPQSHLSDFLLFY